MGVVASMTLAVLVGCGGGPRLSGTVTLDGKPLTHGEVTFVGDGLPTAYATIGTDGSYSVRTGSSDTIEQGVYRVSVAAYEEIPSKNPYSPPGKKLLTPAKYRNANESGFTVEVKRGRNTYDLKLATPLN